MIWRWLSRLRPVHTRGFAPGACSRILLHVSVHTRERYLPRELAPKYLTGYISWSILRGGNSAPEDEVYPWNRWYTRRKFAPGACPWSRISRVYRPLRSINISDHLLCWARATSACCESKIFTSTEPKPANSWANYKTEFKKSISSLSWIFHWALYFEGPISARGLTSVTGLLVYSLSIH